MVHSATLKEEASILATTLSVMFSHSLSQDILPEIRKLAHIITIFKGGQRRELSSYRPVALHFIRSKIMESDLLLFADDVELWKEIRNQEDKLSLQEDLTRPESWVDDDGFTLNSLNCKVVHLRCCKLQLQLRQFSSRGIQNWKNLGVLVYYDLKSYANCDKNAFRTNLALVTLKRIFDQFDGRTLHLYFSSFRVRKNSISSFIPKNKGKLERIQRQATKSVRGLKLKVYEEYRLS